MIALLHGQPVELSALQYPRHLHRSDTYRIVADAEDAMKALEDGWTLSPGDPTLDATTADPSVVQEDLDPAVPPVAVRKKSGRPRKVQE